MLWELLKTSFFQYALLASLLTSLVCGILGSYVVARRSSYMVGAVSHSLLGGIGLARWCQAALGIIWFTPMLGSILAAVAATLLLTFLSTRQNFREDTVLSSVWTVGVAIGFCFIAVIPGYAEDLNGYLFGNILLLGKDEIKMMLLLTVVAVPLVLLLQNRLLALCFHEEGLALRGISTRKYSLILNLLTGLAVVILSQTVGLMMVLALMTLPAATAARLVHRMPWMMFIGSLLALLSCIGGLILSLYTNLPAGALIILCAATLFALVLGWKRLFTPTAQIKDK